MAYLLLFALNICFLADNCVVLGEEFGDGAVGCAVGCDVGSNVPMLPKRKSVFQPVNFLQFLPKQLAPSALVNPLKISGLSLPAVCSSVFLA